jgi:hypothetical protein
MHQHFTDWHHLHQEGYDAADRIGLWKAALFRSPDMAVRPRASYWGLLGYDTLSTSKQLLSFQRSGLFSCTAKPWIWRLHFPLKCQELFTSLQGIISLKASVFINTAVRNSSNTLYKFYNFINCKYKNKAVRIICTCRT